MGCYPGKIGSSEVWEQFVIVQGFHRDTASNGSAWNTLAVRTTTQTTQEK